MTDEESKTKSLFEFYKTYRSFNVNMSPITAKIFFKSKGYLENALEIYTNSNRI